MDPAAVGSSSVRPRQRRMNSTADEELRTRSPAKGRADPRTITPLDSPLHSRAFSPIPSTHPSRSISSSSISKLGGASNGRPLGGLNVGSSHGGSSSSTTFTSGLLESWSALQGLASSVLSSDPALDAKDKPNAALRPTRRKKFVPNLMDLVSGSSATEQWGPQAPQPQIGAGSKASREAQVRAKRREDLLSSSGDAVADSLGRFKRRGSDDRGSASAPPLEAEERDALVYVHHVQPEDTLAGVSIKFNCSIPVLRKANRLWPNDTIQIKKTVVIPVDACAVKGRPCSAPGENVDLLGDSLDEQATPKVGSSRGVSIPSDPFSSSLPGNSATGSRLSSSAGTDCLEEPPWKHDSWVMLDHQPGPVEIARLSRKTLGYFPLSRQKSVSFSDLDTPAVSIDLPRSPKGTRSRRDSASYFAQHLQGPGGVGTLGRDVISPGPAPDKLNKLFAPLAPSVAPPSRTSFESYTSNASSTTNPAFDNVGSAIEGWVRKMATKAVTLVEPPPGARRGDLIELDETPESPNEFSEGSLDQGGGSGSGSGMAIRGRERPEVEQQRLLDEHFPPPAARSRVVAARNSTSKGRSKKD